MKKNIAEQVRRAVAVWQRVGFCSLWLMAIQVLSCLAYFIVLSLYGKDLRWEWLVYVMGLLLPFLWGLGGYWLLPKFRLHNLKYNFLFITIWTVFPAALCWWAEQGGPDILWITLYPQLMACVAWFRSLFSDVSLSANTIQPVAAGGTHILMMAGFSIGLYMGQNRKQKKVELI